MMLGVHEGSGTAPSAPLRSVTGEAVELLHRLRSTGGVGAACARSPRGPASASRARRTG
jgi:hypothetical protein